MTTIIEDQQEKLKKGLIKAADIITSSMGGGGSTVIIANKNNLNITKDGVSIAKAIKLPDPIENIGAKLLISAAEKTVNEIQDGTTLTSLLLKEMIINTNTREELSQLKQQVTEAKKYIDKHTKKVKSSKDIQHIATTSSNSKELGNLFKEIFDETGLDTRLELELSEFNKTYYEINSGFKLNSGFLHPAFITHKTTEEVIYENPVIYIDIKPMHYPTQFLQDLIIKAHENDQPIVFVANKYSDAVKRFLFTQKIEKGIKIAAINLPGWGEEKQKNLLDLKAYLSEDNYVDKIVINSHYTTFYNNSEKPNLQDRLNDIKSLKDHVIEPYEKIDYEKRYYNLTGNVATIFVGSNTEESKKEIYDRVEDAIGAINAAVKQGYTLGAGKLLYNFSPYSPIFSSAYNKILSNAFIEPQQVKDKEGYNVKTKQIVDLYKEGIIDPAATLKAALDNALANTELVLNTKYTIYNEL